MFDFGAEIVLKKLGQKYEKELDGLSIYSVFPTMHSYSVLFELVQPIHFM